MALFFEPRQTVTRLYFEDFKPGLLGEFGPREITRDEIIAFATEFDPQSMHLDEEAARETMLGGLSASGWHTCGVMMRMRVRLVHSQFRVHGRQRHRRGEMAASGPSRRPVDPAHDNSGDARIAGPSGNGFCLLSVRNAECVA